MQLKKGTVIKLKTKEQLIQESTIQKYDKNNNLVLLYINNNFSITFEMFEYLGKDVIISKDSSSDVFNIVEDLEYWSWYEQCIDFDYIKIKQIEKFLGE